MLFYADEMPSLVGRCPAGTEVGAFYWRVPAPDIVNPGRGISSLFLVPALSPPLIWSVRRIGLVSLCTFSLNRAYSWSNHPILFVYPAERVVIGPANHTLFGWPSPISTAPQWFCGYPARCRSVVLGNVGHSERGSRNL